MYLTQNHSIILISFLIRIRIIKMKKSKKFFLPMLVRLFFHIVHSAPLQAQRILH